MESICGADCSICEYGKNAGCQGCKNTNGCPFGSQCFIAKIILEDGMEKYENLQKQLLQEINSLCVEGMPKVAQLFPLNGVFVNLAYPLPNGNHVSFLNDNETYLGSQVVSQKDSQNCFGIVANLEFILVCTYSAGGENPALILFQKRGKN